MSYSPSFCCLQSISPETRLILRRSPLCRSITPSLYHSVTLLLCGPAAPSLHRSVAGEVSCSVPHCCRDRSVQSGERRLQSRERGACRAEREAPAEQREAPHSRNGGGTQQKRRRHTAETGKQILKTQSGLMCSSRLFGNWGHTKET